VRNFIIKNISFLLASLKDWLTRMFSIKNVNILL